MKRFALKVTPENVKELFSEYPIVCEAFDKPDQKAMLVRELLDPVSGDDSSIGKRNGGLWRYKRDQNTADDADGCMCAEIRARMWVNGIGLIAPRVAACAAHEANKVHCSVIYGNDIDKQKKGDTTWKINLY